MHARILRSALVAAAVVVAASSTRAEIEPPSVEQFVGTTPCGAMPRRFVGIAGDAPCERITWLLVLSKGSQGGEPATYTLAVSYGVEMQNGPGMANAESHLMRRGSWTALRGTNSDPNAVVYRLTSERGSRWADCARIGENLLHPLNDDKNLAVGNASWSYTLSRTGPIRPGQSSSELEPDAAVYKGATGVFEGRTPCQEIAGDLGVRTPDGCFKLKWRLTLRQESGSRAPTTYKLEGTLYRSSPLQGPVEIMKDVRANRNVYRLNIDNNARFMVLFEADDNILLFLDPSGDLRVGDERFSYTLNRTSARP